MTRKVSHRTWCIQNNFTFEKLARESLLVAQEEGALGSKPVKEDGKPSRNEVSIFTIYNRVCQHSGRTEIDPIIEKAKARLTNV